MKIYKQQLTRLRWEGSPSQIFAIYCHCDRKLTLQLYSQLAIWSICSYSLSTAIIMHMMMHVTVSKLCNQLCCYMHIDISIMTISSNQLSLVLNIGNMLFFCKLFTCTCYIYLNDYLKSEDSTILAWILQPSRIE